MSCCQSVNGEPKCYNNKEGLKIYERTNNKYPVLPAFASCLKIGRIAILVEGKRDMAIILAIFLSKAILD